MQGFSHSGSAEWDLRFHLNEDLTILPFRGWGGRQLSTRGLTGSFSSFLERLRSFAICKGEKLKGPCGSTVDLLPRTNSETKKEFSYIMMSTEWQWQSLTILVEIADEDHCSPVASTGSMDLHTLHPQNSASSDPCMGCFWIFLWFTPTVWKKNRALLWSCWSWTTGK